MNAPKERILLVENDPSVSDLIARQTLIPLGFRVQTVDTAPTAIHEAARFAPDVMIVNLSLPGLSGKDLLAAFSVQGLDVPIIVIAEKGMENDVIQAFRLGASDFLGWPLREAEVVSAVERVLRQVRSKREKETLSRQLDQMNQELQRRVRELTTIFAIGKAVISITDVRTLMEKIVEGAVYVAEADVGWLSLKDERSKNFILSAHRNLPKGLAANLNQPWDDGLGSLVASSGHALAIHGEPLKQFKVAILGQAALVVPIKVKNDVVGLLTVIRKASQPMGASSQALLEAVADYASIAIVNARLFKAVEERAFAFQVAADTARLGEEIVDELILQSSSELTASVVAMRASLESLVDSNQGKLNDEQNKALLSMTERLQNIVDLTHAMSKVLPEESAKPSDGFEADLNDLLRKSVSRYQPLAQHYGVTILTEFSPRPVVVKSQPRLITRVMDGLLTNAIRQSPQDTQVLVRLERTADNQVHCFVLDKGPGIDTGSQSAIFSRTAQPAKVAGSQRFAGLGISLALMKDIVTALNGRIWANSKPGAGTIFHFSLPAK